MTTAATCLDCAAARRSDHALLIQQGWTLEAIAQAVERYGPARCERHQREHDRRRRVGRIRQIES